MKDVNDVLDSINKKNSEIENKIDNINNSVLDNVDNIITNSNTNTNTNSNIDTNINRNIEANTNNNINANTNSSINTNNYNKDIDEELLRIYIGNNYDKIISGKFNFCAFFFNVFYLFYRREIAFGICILLINLLIGSSWIYGSFITSLVLGFIFNKMYINKARRKISEIKLVNNNKSLDEIRLIVLKKGGVSVVNLVIVLVINFLLVFISILFFTSFTYTYLIDKIIDEDFNIDSDYEFYGYLYEDHSININDYVSLNVDNNLFKDMSLPYKYAYSYVTSDNDFSTCDFDLKAIRDYDSSEDVILDLDNYYNNATINNEKLVVNGFTWYWTYYDKNYAKEYYYATEFDGRVFVYTYLVEDDATSKCDKYRLDILNSIYFNKKQQVA